MERKYSLAEIDAMRRALGNMYPDTPYYAAERASDVENRLRTHMQNGTEPSELTEASRAYSLRRYEAQEQMEKDYRERKNASAQWR